MWCYKSNRKTNINGIRVWGCVVYNNRLKRTNTNFISFHAHTMYSLHQNNALGHFLFCRSHYAEMLLQPYSHMKISRPCGAYVCVSVRMYDNQVKFMFLWMLSRVMSYVRAMFCRWNVVMVSLPYLILCDKWNGTLNNPEFWFLFQSKSFITYRTNLLFCDCSAALYWNVSL